MRQLTEDRILKITKKHTQGLVDTLNTVERQEPGFDVNRIFKAVEYFSDTLREKILEEYLGEEQYEELCK